MKSFFGFCFRITPLLVLQAWFVCTVLLAWPSDVRAYHTAEQGKDPDERTPSLQESIRKERAPGAIFMAIPVAYRYGLTDHHLYCSPSIRATNSSNADIEELIIGIDYVGGAGERAGATVTRYANIKVRRQDTHYFYQLNVSECKNIVGEVSVIRCVFTSGEDCSSLVKAINFGAIPLRMKSR